MDISSSVFAGWDKLGLEFDILYENFRIPTRRLGYSKVVLLYDGEKSQTDLAAFKLDIFKNNTANIAWIQAMQGYSGTFILKMLIQLCKHIGVTQISLVDAAMVDCGPDESIYLSCFKILTEGQTFYGKHGGFRANIKQVDDWETDLASLVKQFQEVKLADYVANLQTIVNLVSKNDVIFTETIDQFSPTEMISGILPGKYIIEKYETIIAKCLTSNQEYLYQYMIDIVRSTDYLVLESILYSSNQIYSFSTEDGFKVCREYVIPAIKATMMVREPEYILKL